MNRILAALGVVSVLSGLAAPDRVGAADTKVTLVVERDATRDVVRVPRGCPGTGCAPALQGRGRPGADITSMGAEYGPSLRLDAEVRGIARRVYFTWRIRAAGQDHYAVLTKRRGKETARFFDADFEVTACQGLAGRLDAETQVASVTVPASCFGAPAHVRVGLQTAVVRGKYHVFFDDALRVRFDPFREQGPKLSQRLDRI